MNKSNYFAIFLLFASISSVTSCKCGQKREEPKGKNIICLIDFSDAKNANERQMFYMAAIKDNIIPKLGLYDKVTVLPIDKASVTNSSDIFVANLAQKSFEPELASPMEEDQIIQDNLKKHKDTLSITFEQNFKSAINTRNKTSLGSDIFGALEVVKTRLSLRDDNYVIFFSDMMNWSNVLKMEPQDKEFNAESFESLLAKTPNIDLLNTTIIVLTGEQVDVSAAHFNLVKSFWVKYFQASHAKIYDYNSGSMTKLKELMSFKTE